MWRRWLRGAAGPPIFRDRRAAGDALASLLEERVGCLEVVLAIPRGGLEVAEPVAERLALPLDVLVSRKVGVPGQPELALGSVTRLGSAWNRELLAMQHLSEEDLRQACQDELAEVERRERIYRGVRPASAVAGRRIVLVDDGLATGATMAAAVEAAQQAGVASIVVGVPVATREAVTWLGDLGAQVLALAMPDPFIAVGAFYEDFHPVPEERCVAIIRRFKATEGEGPPG